MALKLITAPTTTPVSLVEAKLHLREDNSGQDDLITRLIGAATAMLDGKDGQLGRALMPQTWELVLDEFPEDGILIPLPPLLSVVSVKYVDTDGVTQTVSTDDYEVDTDSEPGWVMPGDAGWPSTMDTINAVRVRFTCGYEGNETDSPPGATGVPDPLKAAILLMVGHLYANREAVASGITVTTLPIGWDHLIMNYRIWLVS